MSKSELKENSMKKQMLVSFNHPVGIMLDGRAIMVGCALCEDLFSGEVTVVPKNKPSKHLSGTEAISQAEKLTLDFPLGLKIVSLADGKPLKQSIEIMVKWNNVSAICTL